MSELVPDELMSCEDARLLLKARPDSAANEMRLLEHVNACSDCSAHLNSQRNLDAQLAHVLVVEPPRWLTASILAELAPDSETVTHWWARPRMSLALQWAFYVLLTGGLLFGLFVPVDSVSAWFQMALTLPAQLGIALDVLWNVLGLIPIDALVDVLDDSPWVFEAAALALVFWWLRQGSAPERSPQA